MPTDPTTLQDKLIHVLGGISGATSILRSSSHYVDILALEHLEEASGTLKGIIKEMPNEP